MPSLECSSQDSIHEQTQYLILALGDTGGGKTALGLTHPGKKFAYYFDPNSLRTALRFKDSPGFQLDYKTFLPDRVDMSARSLKKGVGDKPLASHQSKTYLEWEQDFENRIEADWFRKEGYECLILDSLTTFGSMVMDRILAINGRAGEWPQQDDWGPQMNAIQKVMRQATSLGLDLFVTGHYELKQDEISKRIFYTPLVTGRLRSTLPILFSEIWRCEAVPVEGKVKYQIQIVPDRLTPLIRSTMKWPEKTGIAYDVTLDFDKPLNQQGMAKILAMQASGTKVTSIR